MGNSQSQQCGLKPSSTGTHSPPHSALSNFASDSNSEPVSSFRESSKNRLHPKLSVGSSGKRTFSDIESSPEAFEKQAKKSNTHYKRCCKVPEEATWKHTGLTGAFSTVQLDKTPEDRDLKRSSPIGVTKSLFSELEDPNEDVFEDEPHDFSLSSFTSPQAGNSDICRSLSLDSDCSQHETSLTIDSHKSPKQNRSSTAKLSLYPVDKEEIKPTPVTKSYLNILSAAFSTTPRFSEFGRESHCSSLKRLSDSVCSVTHSPSFIKPKTVVAFRSYCSSINRSNMSGVSHDNTDSLDAMDMSPAASYNFATSSATPVQRRSSSITSINSQV